MIKKEENNILSMKENDIIAKLQGTFKAPTANIILDRIGIPVTLKGLTRKEMELAKKNSIERKKIKGQAEERLNNALYDANIIIAATTNFDWEAAKPDNISDAAQFIMRKLLAGEITSLASKVMELSGFGEELDEEEEIKNSSEAEEK